MAVGQVSIYKFVFSLIANRYHCGAETYGRMRVLGVAHVAKQYHLVLSRVAYAKFLYRRLLEVSEKRHQYRFLTHLAKSYSL